MDMHASQRTFFPIPHPRNEGVFRARQPAVGVTRARQVGILPSFRRRDGVFSQESAELAGIGMRALT